MHPINPRWFPVSAQQVQEWCHTTPDLHQAASAWVHEIPVGEVTPEHRRESKLVLFGLWAMQIQGPGAIATALLKPLEAHELRNQFRQQYPQLVGLFFEADPVSLRPSYTLKAQAQRHYRSDPKATGTVEHLVPNADDRAVSDIRALPELGPKRTFASGRLHPFKPVVLDIQGRRFKVSVTTLEFRDGSDPGEVTFEETTEPETPFTVWDPSGPPPQQQTSAFGQPIFVLNPVFPVNEGHAAYHLLTFETGWGLCGNENYMVALDADGYPVAVFHEASCC